MNEITIPARDEIAPEHTWNDQSLFANVEAWKEEFQSVVDGLPEFERFKGLLADGPENMEFIIELLVKNNIIINENSIKNNIDEIREYIESNYFEIDNKEIEKYLENYDL